MLSRDSVLHRRLCQQPAPTCETGLNGYTRNKKSCLGWPKKHNSGWPAAEVMLTRGSLLFYMEVPLYLSYKVFHSSYSAIA